MGPNDIYKQSLMFVYLLFLISCVSKYYSNNLHLELLNEELRIGSTKPKRGQPCINTCAEVSFKLSNLTEDNYLLYNFKRLPYLATEKDSLYQNKFIFIAGVHVFVYDSSNKQIGASVYISDDIDYKAMTHDFVETKIKESREEFRISKQIIRKGESLEFNHKIDFKDFELDKGIYYIKLIYLQGPKITNKIAQELIEEDENSNNAKVFIGRFWSNKVKLVVE